MILSVAVLNTPARRAFDYLPPGDDSRPDNPRPDGPVPVRELVGRRVLAPLRGRMEVGIVMRTRSRSDLPESKLKRVAKIFGDMPALPEATLDLIRFCADYYCCAVGVAAAQALPPPLRRNVEFRPGKNLTPPPPPSNFRTSLPPPPPSPEFKLTPEQQAALDAAEVGKGFAPHLLFGATGSGKTEVYLRLVARVLASGGRALMLAPEIHLTPQLQLALQRRFPDKRVVAMHSAMTPRARAESWLAARNGLADVVLGTRTAVFVPVPNLKIIVVDEEHDESFREAEQGLLFSARDLAAWRAKREGAAFVAGSATPSLESFHNAARGEIQVDSDAEDGAGGGAGFGGVGFGGQPARRDDAGVRRGFAGVAGGGRGSGTGAGFYQSPGIRAGAGLPGMPDGGGMSTVREPDDGASAAVGDGGVRDGVAVSLVRGAESAAGALRGVRGGFFFARRTRDAAGGGGAGADVSRRGGGAAGPGFAFAAGGVCGAAGGD